MRISCSKWGLGIQAGRDSLKTVSLRQQYPQSTAFQKQTANARFKPEVIELESCPEHRTARPRASGLIRPEASVPPDDLSWRNTAHLLGSHRMRYLYSNRACHWIGLSPEHPESSG
jgi:hypothetical protein